jgi:hypothetical protein
MLFYQLNKRDKNVSCFYLDIFSTQNLHEFVTLLGKTVLGKLDNHSTSMIKRVSAFFKSFRPSFSFDVITGEPAVTLDIQAEQSEVGLQEIFAYLKASGKRCYIAIDEFQQIIDYPEKGVEALLRSYMQFLPNIKFIFAGSKKHLMDAMFSAVNRPFYQSTQKIGLKEIPLATYRKFALKMFDDYGKALDPDVFDYVYEKMMGHTWYIQFILNQLFAAEKAKIEKQDVEFIIEDILQEESATFKTYCEIVTTGQLRLLRAIAKEHKVSSPFESTFILRHNLTALSSVKLALKSLSNKMLILQDENGGYYVYDRFFSLWLEK